MGGGEQDPDGLRVALVPRSFPARSPLVPRSFPTRSLHSFPPMAPRAEHERRGGLWVLESAKAGTRTTLTNLDMLCARWSTR